MLRTTRGHPFSFNILVWAIALLCHTAARNFAEFFVCRAFLGICEGAITPGFMIVTSMFYTRQEQTQRVGYWCKHFLGSAPFVSVLADTRYQSS